jgi:hypothetical protein
MRTVPFLSLRVVSVALAALATGCGQPRATPNADTTVVELVPPDSVRQARADSAARRAADSAAIAAQDSVLRVSPGYVVDSALAPGEALRRFRVGVAEVDAFDGGAPSLDSLVALFAAGALNSDRAALERLAVTKAEYAWIIFPLLPLGAPPYNQPPDVAWMLQQSESRTGLTRLLDQQKRGVIRIRGYQCVGGPTTYGLLRAWPKCITHRIDDSGAAHDARLFGSVVEYRGRFKILSFANDF